MSAVQPKGNARKASSFSAFLNNPWCFLCQRQHHLLRAEQALRRRCCVGNVAGAWQELVHRNSSELAVIHHILIRAEEHGCKT